jgi:hypothetical protein
MDEERERAACEKREIYKIQFSVLHVMGTKHKVRQIKKVRIRIPDTPNGHPDMIRFITLNFLTLDRFFRLQRLKYWPKKFWKRGSEF